MEAPEVEALGALAAWYERYAGQARKLKRLAPVFDLLEQMGLGRAYLPPGWYLIYGLRDPLDHQVRYVGLTARPGERLQEHQRDARNFGKDAWVQRLALHQQQPLMIELDRAPTLETARQLETFWIQVYRQKGQRLYNQEDRWQEEQSG